jgi:hypothetical protein
MESPSFRVIDFGRARKIEFYHERDVVNEKRWARDELLLGYVN